MRQSQLVSVSSSRTVAWLAVLAALIASTAASGASRPAAVEPVRPGSLAVGPGGVLYIADDARHQILAMTRASGFRVVAGTGRAGSTGDSGPATRAELRDPAGMAVLADGTLLFADQSANRVRAVAPDGTIRTLAGDGHYGWVQSGTPALRALLGNPAAVAVGPGGSLFIAVEGTNEIVRLNRDGTLSRVAGNARFAGIVGVGRPALDASPSGPNGLAFGRGGDLYVAGFNTKTLLLIDRAGIMRLPATPGGFYPRGDGGIVSTSRGRVLAIDTQKVVALTPHGERTIFDFATQRLRAMRAFLPNGIAVAGDGSIYVDTYAGNGWTTRSVIAVIRPDRSVHVLWRG